LGTEMLLVLVHSGSRGLGENYPARQRGRASGGCRKEQFVRGGGLMLPRPVSPLAILPVEC